ncbi:unnamed protein product [Allacma fusca]|uniref:UDP-glycosyltransferase n=1 Tax=Allacma fusca TaxID=39272 RepID=A0A8J2NV33_9HEXA|nr:unnamed protein product [Allacma fusca]
MKDMNIVAYSVNHPRGIRTVVDIKDQMSTSGFASEMCQGIFLGTGFSCLQKTSRDEIIDTQWRSGDGAKILFYFGLSTYSHRISVWPLVEKLAFLGHEVTFFASFPPKKPNINVTEFSPISLQRLMEKSHGPGSDLIQKRAEGNHLSLWDDVLELGATMCEVLMADQEYLNFVTNHTFDLVVIDALHNECAYGVAHYQNSKIIIFDTTHPFQWQADIFGYAAETSWIPDLAVAYPQDMNFFQRLVNTWRPLMWYFRKVFLIYPRLEAAINKGFGLKDNSIIQLRDVESRTGLILTNTHFSIDYARSLPPFVVPVGGMHINTVINPLPEEIQEFIGKYKDTGFVYISFGTATQISKAKPEVRKVFFNAVRKFKVGFVWKWEGDAVPEGLPSNVITAKWLPQSDVLGHPNIKGFITHGGLLSTEEATYHGVPLIIFPFFAEQDYNAEKIHRVGNGIRLEFVGLTEQQLTEALAAILTNPKYDQKMKEISVLFKDQPSSKALRADDCLLPQLLPLSTYSHRIVVWPYVEKLASLGHNVTFLSAFPPKNPNPNVTEFHPQVLQNFMFKAFGSESDIIKIRARGKHPDMWKDLENIGMDMCDVLMKDPHYVDFIQSKHFDLVVIDPLHNECAYGVVQYHKSKFVIFGTSHPAMWLWEMFGIQPETSWIPDMAVAYPQEMSFVERFANTLIPLWWYFGKIFFMYPRIEAAVNEGFNLHGKDRLRIRDLEQNTSLVFSNSHFSVDYARSLPPMFVLVAGLHLTPPSGKNVPTKIQKFMDETGEDGFIYVSFGSAIQISKASPDIKQAFFRAFGNSTTRFIWKWDGPVPSEKPHNVITESWLPQAEILAHPNIKAFINHGGLLGTEEAIANEVPMISFPVFAEQDYNAERMHQVGYGIRMEIIGLKQHILENAIQEILTNPSYKIKMREISRRFKDRPNDPLDTAIWWTEYVLRSPRTPLMMPLGIHQNWFIRRGLDVWGKQFSLFLSTQRVTSTIPVWSLIWSADKYISEVSKISYNTFEVHGAKILFFYAGGTYSHKNGIWPLVTALADRGHDVTLISPFSRQPTVNSRVNDLAPKFLNEAMENVLKTDKLEDRQNGVENELWSKVPSMGPKFCRLIAENSKNDTILNAALVNSTYDLMIINCALAECGIMWAHYKKTRFMLAVSTSIFPWLYDVYGLPIESSWLPDLALQFNYPMGIYDRIKNYLWTLHFYYRRKTETYPEVEKLMMETFDLKTVPDFLDLEREASLVLMNTFPGTEFARALPPFFVQIGGMQCWLPKKPLPTELQSYMDSAEEGMEILGHPKILAYITHCGLNSIMEATYQGVPLIGMPLFGDQDYNAYHIRVYNMGIILEARDLTVEEMRSAISQVSTNKLIRGNAVKISKMFKDRQLSPIEAGVFWTDSCIHNLHLLQVDQQASTICSSEWEKTTLPRQEREIVPKP